MGKEETVMLIRLLHTSPSDNKTKQEWKHGKNLQTTVQEWAALLPLSLI